MSSGRSRILRADDYFVVGPAVVLRTPPGGAGDKSHIELEVHAMGSCLGRVGASRSSGTFVIDGAIAETQSLLGGEHAAEILRLLARVVGRQSDHLVPIVVATEGAVSADLAAALAADGFNGETYGRYVRPSAPFVQNLRAKAHTMTAVYADPFTIPWNFVPREIDVLARVVEESRLPPSRVHVLDLGCGFGKNASVLEEIGFDVSGVDIAPNAIERCRELVRRPDQYIASSATALPWPDGSFDVVVDIGCLHCMAGRERFAAVAEIARVLAPGGVVYSRLFKPRPAQWLEVQPFETSAFGLTEAEVLALFEPVFGAVLREPHDKMTYVRAEKR